MKEFEILPYDESFNEEALELEKKCPQGELLKLRFRRKNFRDRSEVYNNYKILITRTEGKLIGITAAAKKKVLLHKEEINVIYNYDLRIHPDYRRYGAAKKLTSAILKEYKEHDCTYTFIAGQNERALGLAKIGFGARVVIPFSYVIIPVFRLRKVTENFEEISGIILNHKFLERNPHLEFQSCFNENKMYGHVTSMYLANKAGCSLWTNENLLAEEILEIPKRFQFIRKFVSILKPLVALPEFPREGETIKSLFLYDLFANEKGDLKLLLNAVNNYAYRKGKKFLYVFMQNNNPLIKFLKEMKIWYYSIPYYFLTKGRIQPNPSDHLYVDIRDL